MSSAVTLGLVVLAVFGLASLGLSGLLAIAWRGRLAQLGLSSAELLALRLLPTGGGALVALTVALPAFLLYEPAQEIEAVGPVLLSLAALALVTLAAALVRAGRAQRSAGRLFRDCGRSARLLLTGATPVEVLDLEEPIVAVVGGWRQRIIASRRVVAACSDDEFRQVIAHEAAHVSARDNLKLLAQLGCPDVLAWLPTGRSLAARWRAAAEREADETAAGPDRQRRIALAAALIKVARLSRRAGSDLPTLSLSVAVDDVAGRVRALLEPSPPARRPLRLWGPVAAALLLPALSVPFYGLVHEGIELLVALGR
jgi:hypothetical protein